MTEISAAGDRLLEEELAEISGLGIRPKDNDSGLAITESGDASGNHSVLETSQTSAGDDINEKSGDDSVSDADNELAEGTENFVLVNDHAVQDDPKVTVIADEFPVPNEELIAKIITQVEFYFSDDNIKNDMYLLKHIRRNKQGFVSLKVISSFHKMKKLTQDFRVVAYALRKSLKLQVNETGSKVKRIDPLPTANVTDVVPDAAQRTVVAVNLSSDLVENITEQFSKCGAIVQVRIVKPGMTLPPEIRKHLDRHIEFGSATVCALVEYEKINNATSACKMLTNTTDWRHGMRVTMLVPPSKKEKQNNNGKGKTADVGGAGDSDKGDSSSEKKKKKKKRNSRVMELAHEDSPYSSSGSDVDRTSSPCREVPSRDGISSRDGIPIPGAGGSSGKRKESPGRNSSKNLRGNSPKSSARLSGGGQYGRSPLTHESEHSEDWRARSSSFGTEILGSSPGHGGGPWSQSRLLRAKIEASSNYGSSPSLSRSPGNLPEGNNAVGDVVVEFHRKSDGVLRQPKGPDGTKGFTLKRKDQQAV